MKDSFLTLENSAEGIFKDRGSKFLAFAMPVDSEESIRENLEQIRKDYHDARHHCYAWRLGPEMEAYRANDDGEPSGTAGKPILGQIQSRELTNVLVVVVRYFGGTLLGTGGLINAYRSATADALDRASIHEVKVLQKLLVEFPYESLNGVMRIVKDYGLEMENQVFDMKCKITLGTWARHLEIVAARLGKIDGCKIVYL